jgi:hypothetical protein
MVRFKDYWLEEWVTIDITDRPPESSVDGQSNVR